MGDLSDDLRGAGEDGRIRLGVDVSEMMDWVSEPLLRLPTEPGLARLEATAALGEGVDVDDILARLADGDAVPDEKENRFVGELLVFSLDFMILALNIGNISKNSYLVCF